MSSLGPISPPTLYGGIELPGRPDPENIRKLDILPVPMINRMMRAGIAIDIPHFNELTLKLEREMEGLKLDIACEIPPENLESFISASNDLDDWSPINVESGQQLATLLYQHLGIGRGKQLKMTKGGDRISTGKKQLELLKQDHPVIGLILKYRERSKLRNTYTINLPRIAKHHPRGKDCPVCEYEHKADTYRVHTELTTTRTDTGRLASKAPNLQNIPARTKLGQEVRAGFIASPGCKLVSRDFAQIELRMLAHCANDAAMLKVFANGGDIHLATAMAAFNIKDPKKVDKLLHRAPCKNVNFGLVYGLTDSGLYDQMALTYATAGQPLPNWIDVTWCKNFIAKWFSVYPAVQPYMEEQHYRAKRYSMVWDILGRVRLVPETRSVHSRIRAAGLRQAGNMPIQSVAAGIMKIGMARVEDTLTRSNTFYSHGWAMPLLPIHDELIVEANESMADAVNDTMAECFEQSGAALGGENMLRVPIGSDGKISDRWTKD